MAPAKFIRDHELTLWFSVPSTASFMGRMKMLKPGAFPSLRISIFAGEALRSDYRSGMADRRPNSIVENFYGPTELTVDCIAQRLEDPPYVTPNRGTWPLERCFPGFAPESWTRISSFCRAERKANWLCRRDKRRADTFEDPNSLRRDFPRWNGERWYRTGDLAYEDAPGRFITWAESTTR